MPEFSLFRFLEACATLGFSIATDISGGLASTSNSASLLNYPLFVHILFSARFAIFALELCSSDSSRRFGLI
jgi:hypothetical protein